MGDGFGAEVGTAGLAAKAGMAPEPFIAASLAVISARFCAIRAACA